MSDNRIVSVGMVGTSWWADAMHLPALASHPNARITAICGRNLENTQNMAERWKIPHVFTDYQAMITSGEIEAIIVGTANDSHYNISMQAMNAGLHVLCEKPLALNYRDAQNMADTAAAKGIHHMVPFTYSFMPTARYLKELIDSGYIGKPYHLNMRYYTGYARNGEYQWRFDVEKAGAGIVGDLGAHFLYLSRWFFGEIISVSCQLGYNVERVPTGSDGKPYEVADDMAIITLKFASGAYGVIHVTAVCYEVTPFGQTHHMEMHGSGGTLYSFTDWDTIQRVSGARAGEGAVKELPIPEHIWGNARHDTVHNTYKDIFRQQDFMTRAFITDIVEERFSRADFHDGARIQRLIDAAIESHKQRCWVDVDSIA